MSNRAQLVPVVGTGAAAAMIFNILPVFLGKAAETFALSDSAAGWLGSTYLAGFGVSSVSASLWLHRVGRKALARGLILAAALLLLLGSGMSTFAGLLATLFAAGLFLGALYTLSFVLAGEYRDATRAVGIKLGGEVALGALLLSLIPAIVYPTYGFTGMLVTLAFVLIVVSPCTQFIAAAKGTRQTPSSEQGTGIAIPRPAVAALAGLFVFTVGQAAIWSFVERAGARLSYDAAAIGAVLSIAVLVGGAGSFLAGAVSERFGKMKPLLFAASIYALSMILFGFGQGFPVYAGAVNLFFFAWLFALPYFVSGIAALDDSGRATSLVAACLAFGSMLGPAIAGQLLRGGDFGLLYLAGWVATVVAYAIILAVGGGSASGRDVK